MMKGGYDSGGGGRHAAEGEDIYNGFSDASSTFTAAAMAPAVEEDEEAELELGLSLGSSAAKKQQQQQQPCRILTAKDFPSLVASRLPPLSPSSVSSSSSPSPSPPSSARVCNAPPSQVVGWPPIRAYRMNSLVNQSKDTMDSSNNGGNNDNRNIKGNSSTSFGIYKNNNKERGGCGPSMFVKVNMDGIPIGRKIDLNAHLCYQTLARALEEMFSISYFSLRCSQSGSEKEGIKAPSKLLGGLSEFVLTYEDRDGDWMLVGDVPWGMFLSTVKRLRIMRTSEANGLSPRFQSKADGQRCKPV